MNKQNTDLYNEKLKNIQESTDQKLQYQMEGIEHIRNLIEKDLIPKMDSTLKQARKTNGRVTKLEEFKKNIQESFAVFKKDLDVVWFFSRHKQITLAIASILYVALFVGVAMSDRLESLADKIIF